VTESVVARGAVSRYVQDLIARQVDEHGVVVWFDPLRSYEGLVASLTAAGATVAQYVDSFFALRRVVDGLLDSDVPPRLIVYVPRAEEDVDDALVELTMAGVIMKPGQHPWQRNTRLSVVAKAALAPSMAEEQLAAIERQVDQGQLSLDDLDRMGVGSAGPVGVLSLIFGAAVPEDIALAFLAGPEYDAQVVERGAHGDLAAVLHDDFGLPLIGNEGYQELRARLANHVLSTELLASLDGAPPSQLASLKTASSTEARTRCVHLARAWRSRHGLRESYAQHAERVQRDLGLAEIAFEPEQIAFAETFPWLEHVLQSALENSFASKDEPANAGVTDQSQLIDRRMRGFWSSWPERYPEVRQRWQLIRTIHDLAVAAGRVEAGLKALRGGVQELLTAYTSGDEPWCLLDTYQRHLEQQCHGFDFDAGHGALERAITRARQWYMRVGGALAERFLRELSGAGFALPGVVRQVDIYQERLGPALGAGKTAYVLVDALRFEMGKELAGRFHQDYEVELEAAVAAVPTLTPVGMGALMPGAASGIEIVQTGPGRIAPRLGETVLGDRKVRLARIIQHERSRRVVTATLEDLLPRPKKKLQDEIRAADLVVVTSQEIDALAEGDNVRLAHMAMDNVLLDLGRLANKLRDLGCRRIVVTADHGYLFADEAETDMKIEPPGGRTAGLHRRVWIGRGGSANAAYLRTPLRAVGMGGDLDIAVPWGFGVFIAAGGARAYYHGGMSPQEMIIPVISLTPSGVATKASSPEIEWEIVPGSGKITTKFFSVTVRGRTVGLLDLEAPLVRVEVRSGGAVISTPVSASYGYVEATGDVQLRITAEDNRQFEPDTITFMVNPPPAERVASVHLLDPVTGRELDSLADVTVSMLEY
jgi:PglZ domain